MVKVLKWLWQFPQNVLGVLVILFTDADYYGTYDCWVAFSWKDFFGVSLGSFIVFGLGVPKDNEETIKHERGHQKQSLLLGPLYLVVIGIPSALGNLLHRVIKFDYYRQPWEWWADKLGGVDRHEY